MHPVLILRSITALLLVILIWDGVIGGAAWLRWMALALGVGGFIALSCYQLEAPWVRHHDWNGALFSHFARNHVEQGLGATRGMDLWNGGSGPPLEPEYYLNHPPLITWWLTGSFLIFGVSEAVARLTGTLVVTASILFVWWRTLRAASPAASAVFWIVLIQLPGFMLYSRMPGHEWPTMAAIWVGAGLCLGEPTKRTWLFSLLGLVLVWSSWVGWVFAAGFFVWFLLRKQWREAGWLAGGTAVGVLLFLGYLWRGYDGNLTPLVDQFFVRSSSSVIDGGGRMEAGTWWPTILKAVGNMVGWIWFGAGMLALLLLWVKRIPKAGLPLMFLLCTALSIGLLRQWAYVHEYWAYYLCALVLMSLILLLQQPLPQHRKAWGMTAVFVVLALWIPGSVDRKIQARSHPLIPAQHEWKVAVALAESIPPGEAFTAMERPSPIFLYYANRDFIRWGSVASDQAGAFVQIHGRLPGGDAGEQIRTRYQASPYSSRVFLKVEGQE